NDRLAVKIFTARRGVGGIPAALDGVPVEVVVTGKFYALPKGNNKGPKDSVPPSSPTGLSATAVSDSRIDLNWDDNNTEPDFSHYIVYRSTGSGGSYVRIAPRVKSSAYSDTGLAAATSYTYLVRAVDKWKNHSGYSNPASAATEGGSGDPPDESPEAPIGPRPAPIGVSTGHPNITAGTIGCRVTDGTRVYALSNNHVYANQNNASRGDNVLQPGTADGGEDPRDKIGTLSDFVPIKWSGTNEVDAAIALSTIPELGRATPSGGYGTPRKTIAEAAIGMDVQKYGRTTRLTRGYVTAVNATVDVGYGFGRVARFTGQIIIEPGGFSAGGDSGSLVVTDSDDPNEDRKPVGLLFAGSSTITVANPIEPVLRHFNVTVDGE
ncbi:MAG: fibronectin type III domain-containing protein, partial [Planctomycetota bacterium]